MCNDIFNFRQLTMDHENLSRMDYIIRIKFPLQFHIEIYDVFPSIIIDNLFTGYIPMIV